ncbi:MAG: HlyD family efflux transporter periplasmic adaptor subunit [Planctomycetes bacterium]|nr:HlyD family efflux transporter periplasmic adaptor subunit [Planctomycetota bacterium]
MMIVLNGMISARVVLAQDLKSEPKGPLPVASAGDQVIVKREASRLIEPQKYRVSLSLEPIRQIAIAAPFDGVIKQVTAKVNSKLQPQVEIARIDTSLPKLKVQRAEAAFRVAGAKQKSVDKADDEDVKELAKAEVEVAKADLEIARMVLESCSIRSPIDGELQRILVSEGQFIKAGDPIAIVVDSSKLRVEVPAERSTSTAGKPLGIKIEAVEVEGTVESILPLGQRFEILRDLFDSVTSAVVIVDNAENKFKPGQTVYVPLIPRQPVMEVATTAIGNLPDGQRKVQVVRQGTVRDIAVVVMGSVGTGRLFVSGPFSEADEVIVESSHQLNNGFQLKPMAGAAGPNVGATSTSGDSNTTKKTVGF